MFDIELSTGARGKFTRGAGEGLLPTVLIVHGWGSNPASNSYCEVAERLNAARYNTFALALRGHGGAEGDRQKLTRVDHTDDICLAFGWLATCADVDKSRLCGLGVSYGAYLLSNQIRHSGLKLFAMRAPALYPDDRWNHPSQLVMDDPNLAVWRAQLHSPFASGVLSNLRFFKGKLLIVSSEHDEQMPSQVVESYLNAAMQVKEFRQEIIPGSSHTLTREQSVQYLDMVACWFRENYPTSQ